MKIGNHFTENNVFVAPMAGVTDRPFRALCKKLGAGYAVSEMVTSRADLINSVKTQRRLNHQGESGLIAVQIAGTEPVTMAQAALFNVQRGAQIIESVVKVCSPQQVPVTLKMRTGWSEQVKNASRIALLAENIGVQMITVHGRTRELGYKGHAEYETIAQVKSLVKIPVVANGDIDSPEKAAKVLAQTGANALMIGRAAMGRPWIFREIKHFLETGRLLASPLIAEVKSLMLDHLEDHYSLYGEVMGVRTARKHIGWYVKGLPGFESFKDSMHSLETTNEQLLAVSSYFDSLSEHSDRLPAPLQEISENVYE